MRRYSRAYRDKQKRKQEKKAARAAKKAAKKPPAPPPPPPKKKTVKDYLKILRQVIYILKRIQKRARAAFRIEVRELDAVIATGDAASTAIAYGAVSQAVSYLLALTDAFIKTHYRNKHIAVTPDDLGSESTLSIHIVLRTNLLRVIGLGFTTLFAYLASRKKNFKTEE